MIENAPLLSAVAVPKSVVPLYSFTVLPASAVPEIAGVESVVNDEETIVGAAAGAVASIVIESPEEAEEVLPAESVAVAVKE